MAEAAFEASEQPLAQRQVELGDVATRARRPRALPVVRPAGPATGAGVEGARCGSGRPGQTEGCRCRRSRSSRAVAWSWTTAVTALDRATGTEAVGARSVEEARVALAEAQHAEMAHELRGSLVAGEPCPVCEPPGHVDPERPRGAPKVTAAARAVEKAEASLGKARDAKERASQARASATTAVGEAAERVPGVCGDPRRAADRAPRGGGGHRDDERQLVEWLGEGDARTLLEARQAELDAAERAVEEARAAVDASRKDPRADPEGRPTQAGKQSTSFANKLSGAWGRLGEDRDVAADPAVPAGRRSCRWARPCSRDTRTPNSVRRRPTLPHRTGDVCICRVALVRRSGARRRFPHRADRGGGSVMGRPPRRSRRSKPRSAGPTSWKARAGSDAESRRDRSRRLSDDLQPSRFLASS